MAVDLEDGTTIVLAVDQVVIEAVVSFLNDASDAARAASDKPATRSQATLQPEEALQFVRCWFCDRNDPDDSAAITTKLQRRTRVRGQDDRESIELQTETAAIKVPRCTACAGAHARRRTWSGLLLGLLGLLLFISAWFALGGAGYPKLGFVVGLALAALCAHLFDVVELSRRFLPPGVKAEIEGMDFPPAKRLAAEGWKSLDSKEPFYTRSNTDGG